MPTLSEQWATAYVQIIITLVVFALGVPALAFQLIVQDDIRKVFHRQVRLVGWFSTIVVLLAAFFVFVWYLHPPYEGLDRPPAAPPAPDGIVLTISLPLAPPQPTVAPPSADDEPSRFDSMVAGFMMTVLPLIIIVLGLIQIKYLRRSDIITILERDLTKDLPELEADSPPFRVKNLKDPGGLAVKLREAADPLSRHLRWYFSPRTQRLIERYDLTRPASPALTRALADDLDKLLKGPCLFTEWRFAPVALTAKARGLVERKLVGAKLVRLNRLLLEEAYPHEVEKAPPTRLGWKRRLKRAGRYLLRKLVQLRDYTFMKKRAKVVKARPLNEETLHDLIYLGHHGKAGKDKKLVLDALCRIANRVQAAEWYQGDGLENLIRGLIIVVRNSEQPGEDEDFDHVIAIIRKLGQPLTHRSLETASDASLLVTALEELGVYAVKIRSEQTAGKYLEEATGSGNSRVVFEMGLAALQDGRFHMAAAALNKLARLAVKSKPNMKEAERSTQEAKDRAEEAERRAREAERRAEEAEQSEEVEQKEREERRLAATYSRMEAEEGRHLLEKSSRNLEESKSNATAAIADLLGMIAEFEAAGASARRCARDYLARNLDYFSPTLEACLEKALDHHYKSTNFDTADRIDMFLKGLREGTWLLPSPPADMRGADLNHKEQTLSSDRS